MAYRFIEKHQGAFGLRWLLIRMGIYPNGYYNYFKQAKADYQRHKTIVCQNIESIYHELSGIVGHRAMRVFLERKGISLSKATTHKYMNKELHLHCVCRCKRPVYKKSHAHKVFPNLLQQNFLVERPNQVWCTDFTYRYLTNGMIRYNCMIIDLYDRSVVSSINERWMTTDLAVSAVKKAIQATGCNPKGLILHSDQGSQFTSLEFILFCRDLSIQQSMSHTGCPYDNAPMERYYNTLKAELIYQYNFDTIPELDHAVSEFAYNWYNQIRPHSYNEYRTPF